MLTLLLWYYSWLYTLAIWLQCDMDVLLPKSTWIIRSHIPRLLEFPCEELSAELFWKLLSFLHDGCITWNLSLDRKLYWKWLIYHHHHLSYADERAHLIKRREKNKVFFMYPDPDKFWTLHCADYGIVEIHLQNFEENKM